MNTQELLKLYQKIATKHDLPPLELQTVGLIREHESIASPQQALEAVQKFHPITGWLGFQSCTRILRRGEELAALLAETTAEAGVLLNAEVVNDTGVSLQVRYDGTSSWLLTSYTETEHGEYLADTVKLVIHGSPGGLLHYKRFWDLNPEHGTSPCAACLVAVV